MATRVILTYADYTGIPADGRRYELHDGEIFVTPAPTTWHQRIIGRLFVILNQYVQAMGLGEVLLSPVDCILSDITVVQPDIVFVEAARLSIVTVRGIEDPPTLVSRRGGSPDGGEHRRPSRPRPPGNVPRQ